MAYKRARGAYRSGRRTSNRRRTQPRSRRAAAGGTVRIVIEQPSVSPLQRPELSGLTMASTRKRSL